MTLKQKIIDAKREVRIAETLVSNREGALEAAQNDLQYWQKTLQGLLECEASKDKPKQPKRKQGG